MPKKSSLAYSELITQQPDWVLLDAQEYGREENEDLDYRAKERKRRIVGIYVNFLQKNNLTRTFIEEIPLNISSSFRLYLRDVTPEGLAHYRSGYMKWLTSLDRNINADVGDQTVLIRELKKTRGATS